MSTFNPIRAVELNHPITSLQPSSAGLLAIVGHCVLQLASDLSVVDQYGKASTGVHKRKITHAIELDDRILSFAADRTFVVWSMIDQTATHVYHLPFDVTDVVSTPDQCSVFISDNTGSIHHCELNTGVVSLFARAPFVAKTLTICDKAKMLIVSHSNGSVTFFDLVQSIPIAMMPTRKAAITASAISHNARFLAFGYSDGAVAAYDITRITLPMVKPDLMSEKPKSDYLKVGVEAIPQALPMPENMSLLWVETGVTLGSGPVVVLDFSPDDAHIASSATECVSYIWDVSPTEGACPAVFQINSVDVPHLIFLNDGSLMVASSAQILSLEPSATAPRMTATRAVQHADPLGATSDWTTAVAQGRMTPDAALNWVCGVGGVDPHALNSSLHNIPDGRNSLVRLMVKMQRDHGVEPVTLVRRAAMDDGAVFLQQAELDSAAAVANIRRSKAIQNARIRFVNLGTSNIAIERSPAQPMHKTGVYHSPPRVRPPKTAWSTPHTAPGDIVSVKRQTIPSPHRSAVPSTPMGRMIQTGPIYRRTTADPQPIRQTGGLARQRANLPVLGKTALKFDSGPSRNRLAKQAAADAASNTAHLWRLPGVTMGHPGMSAGPSIPSPKTTRAQAAGPRLGLFSTRMALGVRKGLSLGQFVRSGQGVSGGPLFELNIVKLNVK
ncbi:hypothetical protein J8273_3516 [Carpediemonas membranifera]|uniref:Uncharacterized protein n=1 Tax=Carpediemonas membranifera TaxID=201153 RepID=A0A8J6AV98_9EUKA|nr:hypothetical protein J8273_3516 [Carpediemonas membranifera]|eukprot:KAG9393380.1 hypothetical protein J8273_3516 [Carpediemonas membranifera]